MNKYEGAYNLSHVLTYYTPMLCCIFCIMHLPHFGILYTDVTSVSGIDSICTQLSVTVSEKDKSEIKTCKCIVIVKVFLCGQKITIEIMFFNPYIL